jgi:hypothetical protein
MESEMIVLKRKFNILNIVIVLLIGVLGYFIFLPPLNVTSMQFWFFVMFLLFIFVILSTFNKISVQVIRNKKFHYSVIGKLPLLIFAVPILILVVNFILSPLFNSKGFSSRIAIVEDTEENNFISEISEVDFSALPLLDKDSSRRLGDRVMGQMPELVSQFYVSNLYTQINYKNEIIRVTPLEYNGIFKYLSNYKDGVMGYITVNSTTGEANLIKLSEGMKYMPSAYLFKDLNRHLRFSYPTKIFGESNFEIDNDGNPYWITPTLKYIGVELREDVEGIIITDAITGKCEFYKVGEVPAWVDHVYNASLIISMVNDWGMYREGFFNSMFGQKNVVATTDGYNYMVMDDDVYLYTGITSVSSDESNLGFILTNLRTKDTRFYSVPGAEEYSAMSSAVGQVQQMRYTSTFPLLINLNNRPTYLVSLKDDAGLVKMYGFIDVNDYQKVVVTDSSKGIEVAANNYLNNVSFDINNDLLEERVIMIKSINTAIVDGNTYYYFVGNDDKKYYVSINADSKKLPFVKIGDSVKIKIYNEKDVTEIIEITL